MIELKFKVCRDRAQNVRNVNKRRHVIKQRDTHDVFLTFKTAPFRKPSVQHQLTRQKK